MKLEEEACQIKLTLEHDPPSWAHQYKIAYSKNTSVQDFVQYNAGGAFVPQGIEDQEIADSNQNIYVSELPAKKLHIIC